MTKINNRGKRQSRVLGIDGFNIYNYKSKKFDGSEQKKKGSIFGVYLQKKLFNVKRKTMPISSIVEVHKFNSKAFSIVLNES